MSHADLRGLLDTLETAGELNRITSAVDPRLVAAAISQRLAERGGPAVHFANIESAAADATLVSGLLGRGRAGLWSRFALALGLTVGADYRTVLETVTRRIESPIRPLHVADGQCKAVITSGDGVDVQALPIPTLHDGDAGPCITMAYTIAADPDTSYVAWDLIPLTVASRNVLSGRISPETNVGRIFSKYAGSGKPMPFAVVFGGPPMAIAASAFRRGRRGPTDPEIAGSLQRAPLQLVKCETNDLLVPAAAELVLEGRVRPDRLLPSGPFSSSFGYRTPGHVEAPAFEVEAITHREHPVLPFCTWGTPTTDIHIMQGLDRDTQLKAAFEKAGAPVIDVFSPPWLAGSVVAVSTKVPYTAYAQAVAGVVRTTEGTKFVPYVLVCDDDVDITNPVSLFHALVTKCHPKRDTWIIENSAVDEDAPYLTRIDRQNKSSARAIFDCTWPLDWDRAVAVPPKVSFDQCYPKALQERVLRQWAPELGFPMESERPI